MPGPVELAKTAQQAWAESRAVNIDDQGYTHSPEDNLFEKLSAESRDEFANGDGGELGGVDRRGKMQALHSSSALACNVFEYWRNRAKQPLAAALGVNEQIGSLRFEQKFPTGLPGNAPNLDVVLQLESGVTFAIESKFLEPYSKHATGFKAKYFEHEQGLWAARGFAHCQSLAQELNDGARSFRLLHAEQLLKHILGLSNAAAPWHLHYLWYRVEHSDADAHQLELDAFSAIVQRDGIRFSTQTYHALFAHLATTTADAHNPYTDYLRQRYFHTGK